MADYEKILSKSCHAVYDRSMHTQHLSLALVSGRSLQRRYHRTRISGPLAFLWMSSLSMALSVFGYEFFSRAHRSDLTFESPSIRQASCRTKIRNAATIFDGASSTDVHKNNNNNERSSKRFLLYLTLTSSKRQWCRFHHGDKRKPGNFDQRKSIVQFQVEVHVKQWTSNRDAHLTSANVKKNGSGRTP